jgi:hypothetical protein
MVKRDQSKYKSLRDEWRKNNPTYAKEYYLSVRDTPEFKEKARMRAKKWRDANKEKEREAVLKWKQKNKEKVYEINRKWREDNKDEYLRRRREIEKTRRENDPLYKFSQNVRFLISGSFRRGKRKVKKELHVEEILGCTIEFFIEYILSKCPDGVKIEHFGKRGYHIDHIIPLCTGKTEEDIIKLNHYTNLQPLWWKDNLSKSRKH